MATVHLPKLPTNIGICIFICLCVISGSHGVTKGRDFLVAFFEMFEDVNNYRRFLGFLSEVNTIVHIRSAGFGVSDDVPVVAGELKRYGLDVITDTYRGQLEVNTMCYRITSDDDIQLFGYHTGVPGGDIFIALPTPVLSTKYLLASYSIVENYVLSDLSFTGQSQTAFLVMASVDNTQVTITLRMTGTHMSKGCGNGTFFNGESKTFFLNENEIIGAYCGDDITGSVIESDKPVAVLSGNNYENVILSKGPLVEMMLPVDVLGVNYVLFPPPNQAAGSFVRVIGSATSTSVRTSDGQMFPLNEGEFVELNVPSDPLYLESDKPVMVAQITKKNPTLLIVPSTNLYAKSYQVSKVDYFPTAAFLNDAIFFVSVIVPTDMVLGIEPAIFPQFTVIENSCFSFSSVALDQRVLQVTHADDIQFGMVAYPYSFKNFGMYAYAAGYNFTDSEVEATCPASLICEDGAPFPCSCSSGFFEYQCNDTSQGCTVDPCQYGSTCNTITPTSYMCDCVNGTGGAHCEHDITDDCINNTCVNGMCIDGIYSYVCNCTSGFEGVFCEIDIDECASSPCINGTCNNLINMYNCSCTPGFEGVNCEIETDECSSSPCVNGACNNLIDMYNCSCDSGFEGVNCEIDINECDSSPCQNSGTCTDLVDAFSCACVPGYSGTVCETDIDECASDPCVNGSCSNLLDSYTCTCVAGFDGVNCEIDIDECVSSPCVNGACNNLVDMYDCTCSPGFEGVNCEIEINECDSSPCQNGGTCADLIDAFSCACVSGYNGAVCGTDIDECASNPCVNGLCSNLLDSYTCTCTAGYDGVNCEIDIDECVSSPCVNGACNNLVDMYSCSCAPGYEGVNCEIEINECDSSPCQNGGTCTDLVDNFSCACVPGYNGAVCETDIDECTSGPCVHGACNNLIDMYSCTCTAGYRGVNCEIDIDECVSSPCVNGACNNLVDMYTCSCTSGFEGVNCEIDINECASSPCANGGSCTDLIGKFDCACVDGYTGSQCETDVNECASSPCENGGNCSDLVDGYNCTCPVGVEGTNCETVSCSANPCENNATCIDSPTGFTCMCIPGFVGDRCEVDVDECSSDPCKNSGTCMDRINAFECLCPANFSGLLCEILINCGCGCYLTDQSDEELARKVAWIRSLLYLDKNTLSKQVRMKVSIPDDRPVSKGIGYSGVICIAASFGFFLVMDGLNLMKVVGKKPKIIQLSSTEKSKTESGAEDKEKTV